MVENNMYLSTLAYLKWRICYYDQPGFNYLSEIDAWQSLVEI